MTSREALRYAVDAVDFPTNDTPLNGELNLVLVYSDGKTAGYAQVLAGPTAKMLMLDPTEFAQRYLTPMIAQIQSDLMRRQQNLSLEDFDQFYRPKRTDG